jgi:hypothetical protein
MDKPVWPDCPRCEENELFSLDVPATVESIVGCYSCGWLTPSQEALLDSILGVK